MKPSVATRRLFLGLWPDAQAAAGLQRVGALWTWPPQAVRYPPADGHVTLHFLGAVDAQRLPALLPALAVPFTPFTLVVERPQAWPHGLVVLCPESVPAPLLALQAALGQALRRADLPVETRPYRPHLTLARHSPAVDLPERVPGVAWPVSSYLLLESTGDPQKRYRPLARYTAAGGWEALNA